MSVASVQATIKAVTRDRVLSGADSAAIIKAAKKNVKADEINALSQFYVGLKRSGITVEKHGALPIQQAISTGVTTPTFGDTLKSTMGAPIAAGALVGATIGVGHGLGCVVAGLIIGSVIGGIFAVALSPLTFLISLIRHPIRAWRD